MRRAVSAIALVVLTWWAASADADDAPATIDLRAAAQIHVDRGLAQSRAGNMEGALDEFKAAYALVPSPRLLYNVAQVERVLGRPIEAIAHYEMFLNEVGQEGDPDLGLKIEKTKGIVAALRATVGTIVPETDPGTEVLVDGRSRGITPLAGAHYEILAPPGVHKVELRRGSRQTGQTVTLDAGQSVHVAGHLEPNVAPPPRQPLDLKLSWPALASAPPPQRAWHHRWYVWAAAGAMVVALGTTLALTRGQEPPCPSNVVCVHTN